jgi:F-type H+-transporting ATPase subunit gamma
MSSLLQLKRQIKSIKSTAQLTKAMQAVAAMRFKKGLQKAQAVVEYRKHLQQFRSTLQELEAEKVEEYLQNFTEGKKVLSVIIAPSRGFCGGLHRQVAASTYKFLRAQGLEPTDSEQVSFITLHRPGFKQVSVLGGELLAAFNELPKNIDSYDLLAVSELIYQLCFVQKSFKEVYVSFADHISGKVVTEKILPFSLEASDAKHSAPANVAPVTIDVDLKMILEELLHQYLHMVIYTGLLQTQVAEEKARMIAMNQATDNAKKLVDKLQLVFFKKRQTKITQEVNEVSAASI